MIFFFSRRKKIQHSKRGTTFSAAVKMQKNSFIRSRKYFDLPFQIENINYVNELSTEILINPSEVRARWKSCIFNLAIFFHRTKLNRKCLFAAKISGKNESFKLFRHSLEIHSKSLKDQGRIKLLGSADILVIFPKKTQKLL